MNKLIFGISDLDKIVHELWSYRDRCKIYTFTGPLGVGKTTLVRRILHNAGVRGIVSSPTFAYINTYTNANDELFYHLDLYRIKSYEAFIEYGLDEYLYQPNSWAFIEWPEVIQSILKNNVCSIQLEYHGRNKRMVYYSIL